MATSKQVMDVSKPGNAAADPTARPVIVGHGPMMKDPMVTQEVPANDMGLDKPENETKQQDNLKEPTHEKILQPTGDEVDEVAVTKTQPADFRSEQSEEVATENPETPGAPEAQGMDNDADDVSSGAIVDAVVGQASQKKRNGELSDAEKAEQEHIQQLIADKTYFVPIGQVSKRRNRRAVVILLVVLLLILVAVNFMLDAELIDVQGIPHTDML